STCRRSAGRRCRTSGSFLPEDAAEETLLLGRRRLGLSLRLFLFRLLLRGRLVFGVQLVHGALHVAREHLRPQRERLVDRRVDRRLVLGRGAIEHVIRAFASLGWLSDAAAQTPVVVLYDTMRVVLGTGVAICASS